MNSVTEDQQLSTRQRSVKSKLVENKSEIYFRNNLLDWLYKYFKEDLEKVHTQHTAKGWLFRKRRRKGKSIKCPTKNLYIDIWRCAQFIDNDDTSLPLIFNCFLQIALHFGRHISAVNCSPLPVSSRNRKHFIVSYLNLMTFNFARPPTWLPDQAVSSTKKKNTYNNFTYSCFTFWLWSYRPPSNE